MDVRIPQIVDSHRKVDLLKVIFELPPLDLGTLLLAIVLVQLEAIVLVQVEATVVVQPAAIMLVQLEAIVVVQVDAIVLVQLEAVLLLLLDHRLDILLLVHRRLRLNHILLKLGV